MSRLILYIDRLVFHDEMMLVWLKHKECKTCPLNVMTCEQIMRNYMQLEYLGPSKVSTTLRGPEDPKDTHLSFTGPSRTTKT